MDRLVRDICRRTLLLGTAGAVMMAAIGYGRSMPGFLLGLSLGLINMIMLSRDASLVAAGGSNAVKRIVRNYFIRYTVLASVMVAYCGLAGGSILFCVTGILFVQFSTAWAGARI